MATHPSTEALIVQPAENRLRQGVDRGEYMLSTC